VILLSDIIGKKRIAHRMAKKPVMAKKPAALPPESSARDHLANERTLLAWSRTGIAIIALGFVVARFGLLLRELGHTAPHGQVSPGASTALGVAIVLAGVVLLGLALARFLRVGRAIEAHAYQWMPALDIALAGALLAVGIALGIYLLLTA
jgi:putative membrane protein